MQTPIRFTRSAALGGETLTLVHLPHPLTLYCDALGRETPYAVLVEYDGDGQLCDLDGDTVSSRFAVIRECMPATDAPEDVIERLASGWENGATTVERVLPESNAQTPTAVAFQRNLLDRRSVDDLRQELSDIAALYPREVLVAAIVAARLHPVGQRAPREIER